MKKFLFGTLTFFAITGTVWANGSPISEETEACLECHASLHPGIVQEWMKSRHAKVTPALGLKKKKLQRRVSVENVPEKLANVAVGCAECHTLNADTHKEMWRWVVPNATP
jgi:hypothetical protein